MTDPSLQMYLPAFMLIATWLLIFWKQFRKLTKLREEPDAEKMLEYNRLKRVSGIYWIILSFFGIMVIIYSIIPQFYFLFIPLDVFHHPLINTTGLLILKIAIVWIVIAQVNIDKELYKYARNIDSLPAMELVRYSEKMLLRGILVFFIGMFVTITNVLGILFGCTAILIYYLMVSKELKY